jgi:hypothetical protein
MGAVSATESVGTAADERSSADEAPIPGFVATGARLVIGAGKASGVDAASVGLQRANVSGQDTRRAPLAAISSAVSRHVGYRPAIGKASSLLMIHFASLLRPTADISTARLLK